MYEVTVTICLWTRWILPHYHGSVHEANPIVYTKTMQQTRALLPLFRSQWNPTVKRKESTTHLRVLGSELTCKCLVHNSPANAWSEWWSPVYDPGPSWHHHYLYSNKMDTHNKNINIYIRIVTCFGYMFQDCNQVPGHTCDAQWNIAT